MVEEIKLLLPLLEKVGFGGFWLVIVMLAVELLKLGILCASVVFTALRVYAIFADRREMDNDIVLQMNNLISRLNQVGLCSQSGAMREEQWDRLQKGMEIIRAREQELQHAKMLAEQAERRKQAEQMVQAMRDRI